MIQTRGGADLRITYVGGATALLEVEGVRVLVDPTLDPAGTEYPGQGYTLRKTLGPALTAAELEPIDAVLLTHEHHADNLDHAGRDLLRSVESVFTTPDSAVRLGAGAIGLSPWEQREISTPAGRTVSITATPARHGPAGGDRGPVCGFLVSSPGRPDRDIYLSGDTVWYEGVVEVARRQTVSVVVLNAGAAKVRPAGPEPLTLTAAEAVRVAEAFEKAVIVPLHFEGWEHFSEGRADVSAAFAEAGLTHRLRWLEPGRATVVDGF